MKHLPIFSFALLSVIIVACGRNDSQSVTEMQINSGWQFRQAGNGEWLNASVPGSVHGDLLALRKIESPFYRFNENLVQWIENHDWEYTTRFDVPDSLLNRQQLELIFEGLDTYADVYLNDSLILKADNMFVAYSTDVKPLIRKQENSLRIVFRSPVRVGMEKLKKFPYVIKAANEPKPEGEQTNVVSRKAPFHFGWDWGPRLVTSGIWRPVKLRAWDNLRLEDVYYHPLQVTGQRAEYQAQIEIKATSAQQVKAVLLIDNKETPFVAQANVEPGMNRLDLNFSIDEPSLWWPNGLGDAHLYRVAVRLYHGKTMVDQISDRLGVRSLRLVQEPDSIGRSFYFEVNGVPVFMKGANYIPNEVTTPSVTSETYRRIISDAKEAHMNMLRVWGGAIYENNEFYDLCDENGILVWQDFMFACAVMPPDSQLHDEIRQEAEYNVRRLRNHACMALWCGNNENLIAWHTWNWKTKYYTEEQAAVIWKGYEKIFYDILPAAVKSYHPALSYWSSSPSAHGNQLPDRKSGDVHDWGIWFGEIPFSGYETDVPRFVSEYGLQSFPEMATIHTFASDSDLAYRSPVMEHRQRSNMPWIGEGMNGNEMIMRYILKYYNPPKDFASFVYLSQVTQALGLKTAFESHRRNMPRCMGSLYWQINDCWPTMSWASVDYFGRWKAAHYAVRNAAAPIMVSLYNDGGLQKLYVVSDLLQGKKAQGILRVIDLNGKVLRADSFPVEIPANASAIAFQKPVKELLGSTNARQAFMHVTITEGEALLAQNVAFFVPNRDMQLPKPAITTQITKSGDSWQITLTTDKPAFWVQVQATTHGRFSDNFFHLMPDEPLAISFSSAGSAALDKGDFSVRSLADSY